MGRRFLTMAVALGIVAAACGSDDAGELEAYFETLSDVTTTYVAYVGDLPVAGTNRSLDDARSFFSGVTVALDEVLVGLGEMSPPEDLEAAHARFADRVTEFAALAQQVAARGEELETRDDLTAMATDPVVGVANYSSVAAQVVAACIELQAVADAGTTNVDLNCSSLGRE